MENELDLTLRLGPPSPTDVETQLSLNTPTTAQWINVDGGRRNNDGGENYGRRVNNDGGGNHSRRHILWNNDEVIDDNEGARNNVDVNIRYYNLVFNHFAGVGETLNFAPYPLPQSPASVSVTPTVSDYVLIDVPPRRAHRNFLEVENALDANATLKQRRGCGGCCGGRVEGLRKCTNMNCNAINTPMWRRGPLGPKSLCNACGIKFRKEEERRSKRNC